MPSYTGPEARKKAKLGTGVSAGDSNGSGGDGLPPPAVDDLSFSEFGGWVNRPSYSDKADVGDEDDDGDDDEGEGEEDDKDEDDEEGR